MPLQPVVEPPCQRNLPTRAGRAPVPTCCGRMARHGARSAPSKSTSPANISTVGRRTHTYRSGDGRAQCCVSAVCEACKNMSPSTPPSVTTSTSIVPLETTALQAEPICRSRRLAAVRGGLRVARIGHSETGSHLSDSTVRGRGIGTVAHDRVALTWPAGKRSRRGGQRSNASGAGR